MNTEFEKLHEMKGKKGKAAVVFNLKESILGKKKSSEEPSVVLNPKTKKYVFNPSEIVKVSADYCESLLTNNKPKEDYVEDMDWKRLVHEVRMEDEDEEPLKFSHARED